LRVAIVTYRHPVTGSRSFHDFGEDSELVAAGLAYRGFKPDVTSMEELRDVHRGDFDVIYVSNISPDSAEHDAHFFEERKRFYARAEQLNLPIHNGLEADRDRNGKMYLVSLFRSGHEVIPTVDSVLDLGLLPEVENYLSKPKLGFSSRGCLVIERDSLKEEHFAERIVQPFYPDVASEIGVYVIDGRCIYATRCPSKLTASGWEKLEEHTALEDECRLALQFTRHIPNGIARVDLIRRTDGALKVLEIEDNSPYGALPEPRLSAETREKALDAVAASLRQRVFTSTSTEAAGK